MPDPVPQHCPTPRELDDLELLCSGALAPIAGFDEPGSPVRLTLPPSLAEATSVELVDPEGLPLARVTRRADDSWAVEPLARAEYGPFRRLHLTPAESAARYPGRPVVPVVDALTDTQVVQLGRLGPVRAAGAVRHRSLRAEPGRPGARDPRLVGRPRRRRGRRPASLPWRRPDRPRSRGAGRPDVCRRRRGRGPPRWRRHRSPRGRDPGPGPAGRRRAGPGPLLHRSLRQRQVDPGPGAHGPAARGRGPHRDQPRRRRRAAPPLGRPDLLQGRPRDQHPSHRLGGRRDLAPRRRRGLQPDRPLRRDPAAGARHGRRGRRRVLPGPRGHAPGGVRAPRPQGPLRQGPPRRDPRVHRHLLALRGAPRRRRPRRHHRPHHRRRPRRRPERPRRRRLPPHPRPGGRGARHPSTPGG